MVLNFYITQNNILCFLFFAGIMMAVVGMRIRIYPMRFVKRIKNNVINTIAGNRFVKSVISRIIGDSSQPLNRFAQKIINKCEISISIEVLYVLKFMVMFCVIIILVLVRFTNVKVLKSALFSNISSSLISDNTKPQKCNNNSFEKFFTNINCGEIAGKNEKKDYQEIYYYIKKLFPDTDNEQLSGIVEKVAHTYNAIAQNKSITKYDILIVIIAFMSPEIFFALRRILMHSRHKEEIVKLESVFELLGGIKNFKTINILDEMYQVSKLYKNNIKNCMDRFLMDKNAALEELKASVKTNRFKRMIDYIRIYAFVDKMLAIQVLERNRMQNEEEMLLTAEEDVGLMDMIAFSSILPVLLQLTDLLLKPMMATVIKSFNFI